MAGFCVEHKDHDKNCAACQRAKEMNEATCFDCGMEPCNCPPIEGAESNSAFIERLDPVTLKERKQRWQDVTEPLRDQRLAIYQTYAIQTLFGFIMV